MCREGTVVPQGWEKNGMNGGRNNGQGRGRGSLMGRSNRGNGRGQGRDRTKCALIADPMRKEARNMDSDAARCQAANGLERTVNGEVLILGRWPDR